MWIENLSKIDVMSGDYPDPGDNSMLIQIVDPDGSFPNVDHNFKKIAQFDFLDVDDPHHEFWSFRMSDEQAIEMAENLKSALRNEMNVIVHCVAGLCRSGAVTEVALMLGFDGGTRPRQPNVYVKRLLMEKLDLVPDYNDIFG